MPCITRQQQNQTDSARDDHVNPGIRFSCAHKILLYVTKPGEKEQGDAQHRPGMYRFCCLALIPTERPMQDRYRPDALG